ncbi:hypothetical protein ES705_44559 [subsurface metagenome]
MERLAVVSSNIESIGYDAANEVLEVEFRGGAVYQYSGVPKDVYNELMEAESVGRYLSSHIKGIYTCERIE